jgi:hypothetical protein
VPFLFAAILFGLAVVAAARLLPRHSPRMADVPLEHA